MQRRLNTLILALTLVAAMSAPAGADKDASQIERRLVRLEQSMAGEGAGELRRYGESVDQLAVILDKGEYLRFRRFVEEQIVARWRQVDAVFVMQLASAPPSDLAPQQVMALRDNEARVQRIHQSLRRARRLLARVEKLHAETGRRAAALQQMRQQYLRLLADLERLEPAAAVPHRDWLEGTFTPQWRALSARERIVGEKAERLLRWTEEPALKQMLRQLNRVTQALERIRRHYQAHRP
ncbi:MAG: hypothetical protein JW819_13645 [Candidatus Krumholzibacteriota bacterium]|nr:hypothetical protein [Candidatus Krumholzibacteriota bacterium]